MRLRLALRDVFACSDAGAREATDGPRLESHPPPSPICGALTRRAKIPSLLLLRGLIQLETRFLRPLVGGVRSRDVSLKGNWSDAETARDVAPGRRGALSRQPFNRRRQGTRGTTHSSRNGRLPLQRPNGLSGQATAGPRLKYRAPLAPRSRPHPLGDARGRAPLGQADEGRRATEKATNDAGTGGDGRAAEDGEPRRRIQLLLSYWLHDTGRQGLPCLRRKDRPGPSRTPLSCQRR